MPSADSYVIGLDFGTSSVRALLVEAGTGREVAEAVREYPRWEAGEFCDPDRNQFRQHPLDHLEGLTAAVREVVALVDDPARIVGLAVDATASTPGPVNEQGVALGLLPEFADNPDALFILWKDHTAVAEAEEINALARRWGGPDYTRYSGGVYSPEWFWAKITRIVRQNEAVARAAYSWLEHCDWVTLELTGQPLADLKRSRCAAGHKALWHPDWDGLPAEIFLTQLEPRLAGLRARLYQNTYTADEVAGTLSPVWAKKLGLRPETVVAVGTVDAHAGGVGAGIRPYTMVKVMGTSTCDIVVVPPADLAGRPPVAGICGQVLGSVVPGLVGLEAGQSAFGDLLAWFENLLTWPLTAVLARSAGLSPEQREKLRLDAEENLLELLTEAAQVLGPAPSPVLALDWVNGRRTPDANHQLQGALRNLTMGSGAPEIFRALVESLCYGSRRILERFGAEGIRVEQIVAIGGVAKKSAFIMQTLADVLNHRLVVTASEQAPALGAAMYAAVAAGCYPTVEAAQQAMSSGFSATYEPDPARAAAYAPHYAAYLALGNFIEESTTGQLNNSAAHL
ncbi:ribulokinase [Hymenobacter rubripertinctus]|uniref:Ribulokinase n=1 Tax=Hymenobacter rubripertinctus TaxID=2029981 RepID=A0A418QRH8_9BACT|nr:ribulokinase [Hymenobacter rubripertinctus]RIY07754.1 ribulokinase [Hymenobacter rubripertinctus]